MEGKDLKALRLARGMDMTQAAAIAGMDSSYWSKLERGKAKISHRIENAVRGGFEMFDRGYEAPVLATQPADPERFVSTEALRIIPYLFDNREIQVVEADEILMTDKQLGEALGYAQPSSSIQYLVERCIEKGHMLDAHQTIVRLTTVDGKEREVRVWRERGISILSMKSDQPKAIAFQEWAANTIYHARRQSLGSPTPAAGLPHELTHAMAQAFQAIGFTGQAVAEVRQLVEAKPDRSEVVGIIEKKIREADQQVIERVQQLQEKENKAQATKRRKLQGRVVEIAGQAAKKLYPDGFSKEYLQVQIREIQRLISKVVAGAHGTKTWARPDYDDSDFQIAHETLDKFCTQHHLTTPVQLQLLNGGIV